MAVRRTAAQAAASRRNLEKARRAKKSASSGAKHSGKDKRFTKGLSGLKGSERRQFRAERVGGRSWMGREGGGDWLPASAFKKKKGAKLRTDFDGNRFTQTRRQAIMGVRVAVRKRK